MPLLLAALLVLPMHSAQPFTPRDEPEVNKHPVDRYRDLRAYVFQGQGESSCSRHVLLRKSEWQNVEARLHRCFSTVHFSGCFVNPEPQILCSRLNRFNMIQCVLYHSQQRQHLCFFLWCSPSLCLQTKRLTDAQHTRQASSPWKQWRSSNISPQKSCLRRTP